MIKNKPFIDKIIKLQREMNDPVKEFATRNKASPITNFSRFKRYDEQELNKLYFTNIDGIKLKFRYTTVIFNGRHKSH